MISDLSDKAEDYIIKHSGVVPDVLKELYRETQVSVYNPQMISGHIQGRVLKMLCRMVNPANVLEIGTFTGYSAICFAEALSKGAMVHTIEINDELEEFIQPYLSRSGFGDKIKLYIGDALEIIPALNLEFDMAFIDGDKRQYCKYFETVFPKLKPGGFIIADNVLWDNKVLEDERKYDEQTKGINDFNNMVQANTHSENVIFPLGDGLMIIRKKD